jgi:hypothetical protein
MAEHAKCKHGIRRVRCVSCGGKRSPSPPKCEHNQQRFQCWTCRPEGRYVHYKCAARIRGREFTITLAQFLRLVKQPCTYCGKAPAHGIDRIDSTVGYRISNCAPSCMPCNRMKSDFTTLEFLNHIEEIAQWQRQQ